MNYKKMTNNMVSKQGSLLIYFYEPMKIVERVSEKVNYTALEFIVC